MVSLMWIFPAPVIFKTLDDIANHRAGEVSVLSRQGGLVKVADRAGRRPEKAPARLTEFGVVADGSQIP